jgi:four helix bundle protein
MKYDLEERTASFGKSIIDFCNQINKNPINLPLISQLIRSGTSVGANYREANGALSRKDFRHKIYICKKEAQETNYWIEMIIHANPEIEMNSKVIFRESKELILIFNKISHSLKIEN